MKKAARPAVYVKKIPEFVSRIAAVGTVFTHTHLTVIFLKKFVPAFGTVLRSTV
ncbi:MAG: hypothetical protein LBL44_02605 [Treponema sp.]|jgi:hypothetical protein|nr:hypothetical protein [Treponema sp.]